MLKLALLALPLSLTACLADVDDTEDTSADDSSLYVTKTPQTAQTVRIPSDAVATALTAMLSDGVNPLVVVDTTKTAPVKYGPPRRIVVWPNQRIREQMYEECRAEYSGSEMLACFGEVDAEYPNVWEYAWVNDPFYSYINFPAAAEAQGAKDLLFPVAPTYKDSYIGGATIHINHLRSYTETPTITMGPTSSTDTKPTIGVQMRFGSNNPTVLCYHTDLWCPDVNMWNMKIALKLQSIGPSTTTPGQLTYGATPVTFTFERNIVGIPDFLVTGLVDIDAKIRGGVEGKLSAALQDNNVARPAVSKALTDFAILRAKLAIPQLQGFSQIRQVRYENGDFVIVFDWY